MGAQQCCRSCQDEETDGAMVIVAQKEVFASKVLGTCDPDIGAAPSFSSTGSLAAQTVEYKATIGTAEQSYGEVCGSTPEPTDEACCASSSARLSVFSVFSVETTRWGSETTSRTGLSGTFGTLTVGAATDSEAIKSDSSSKKWLSESCRRSSSQPDVTHSDDQEKPANPCGRIRANSDDQVKPENPCGSICENSDDYVSVDCGRIRANSTPAATGTVDTTPKSSTTSLRTRLTATLTIDVDPDSDGDNIIRRSSSKKWSSSSKKWLSPSGLVSEASPRSSSKPSPTGTVHSLRAKGKFDAAVKANMGHGNYITVGCKIVMERDDETSMYMRFCEPDGAYTHFYSVIGKGNDNYDVRMLRVGELTFDNERHFSYDGFIDLIQDISGVWFPAV